MKTITICPKCDKHYPSHMNHICEKSTVMPDHEMVADELADRYSKNDKTDAEPLKQNLHKHKFTLERIEIIPTNISINSTDLFYKKVAYIICRECGMVQQQDI